MAQIRKNRHAFGPAHAHLGKRLRQLRKSAGLRQRDLEDISAASICEIEKGIRIPKKETLIRLVGQLGGNLEEFVQLLRAAVLERRELSPEGSYPTVPESAPRKDPMIEVTERSAAARQAPIEPADPDEPYFEPHIVEWADDRYVIGANKTRSRSFHQRRITAPKNGLNTFYWRFSEQPDLIISRIRLEIDADVDIRRILQVSRHAYIAEATFRQPLRRAESTDVNICMMHEQEGSYEPWIRKHIIADTRRANLSIEFEGASGPTRLWWFLEEAHRPTSETYAPERELRPNIAGLYQVSFEHLTAKTVVGVGWAWD